MFISNGAKAVITSASALSMLQREATSGSTSISCILMLRSALELEQPSRKEPSSQATESWQAARDPLQTINLT